MNVLLALILLLPSLLLAAEDCTNTYGLVDLATGACVDPASQSELDTHTGTADAHFDHADNLTELNTQIGASLADGPHTTDTNASTICTGTDVYLDGEGNCDTISGGGDVTKVGTPVADQIGVWTGDGTLEGDVAFTFDTTTDTLLLGGTGGGTLLSAVTDGATADAFVFNTPALATSGANIASFQNNSVEKAYVDYQGGFYGWTYNGLHSSFGPGTGYDTFIGDNGGAFHFSYASPGTQSTKLLNLYISGNHTYLDNDTAGWYINSGITVKGMNAPADWATSYVQLQGGNAYASAATNITGGSVNLFGGGGASASAGDAHGGNVYLRGGAGYGTGHDGIVYLGDANTSEVISSADTTIEGLNFNVTAATCTGDGNGGKLTVNGSNEIICSTDAGGTESNNLETVTTGIADDEVPMGDGADSVTYIPMPTSGTNGCSGSADKLLYNTATNTFTCGADAGAGGGMTSWTLQGDTGTPETVTDGETVDIAGDTVGIDTAVSATNTITVSYVALDAETENEGVLDLQDLQGAVTDAQVPDSITVTLAATATALAANGANCAAGSYPLGVDASGAVESCTDATTEIDGAITTHNAVTTAHGISAFGATLVDDADAATARTTLDVDQAGTDNSTPVTLAASVTEALTLTGQAISATDPLSGADVIAGWDQSAGHFGYLNTAEVFTVLSLSSALQTFTLPASTTISTFGATLVDDADAATARTTLDVDQAGTDNSTPVTLAGTPDYITLTGQEITRNAIDLAADVTGILPLANGGTGANTSTYTGILAITGAAVYELDTLAELNTAIGASIADGAHTTDTNAGTICTGTTTYLDGEGGCDDLSSVYEPAGVTVADISDLDNDAATLTIAASSSISGSNTGDQTITLTGPVTGSGTGSFATTITDDAVTPNKVKSTGQVDEYCLTYESTGTTFEWQVCGGGSEVNNLESVATGIAAGELVIGSTTDVATYSKISALTEETAPAAGDFLLGEESGGAVRKFDVGDLPTTGRGGYKELWIGAGAMIPSTTSGAEFNTEEYATNDVMADQLLYDGTATEYAQFQVALDGWDESTFKIKAYWTGATGASNGDGVVWGIGCRAVDDGDAYDGSFPTATTQADTLATGAGYLMVSPAFSSGTINGTFGEDALITCFISRHPTDGSDTMAEDAKLMGVFLQYGLEPVTAW